MDRLRALNLHGDVRTRKYRRPKRATFRRVLEAVDISALAAVLLQWQEQLLGPTQDQLVVVDGKKLRHGGAEIVNVVRGNQPKLKETLQKLFQEQPFSPSAYGEDPGVDPRAQP